MNYEYDGTKEKCPVPLVNTRLILKKMQQGDTCTVRLKDPGSIKDIPKLLAKQGYGYSQEAVGNGIIEISIKKNNKIEE